MSLEEIVPPEITGAFLHSRTAAVRSIYAGSSISFCATPLPCCESTCEEALHETEHPRVAKEEVLPDERQPRACRVVDLDVGANALGKVFVEAARRVFVHVAGSGSEVNYSRNKAGSVLILYLAIDIKLFWRACNPYWAQPSCAGGHPCCVGLLLPSLFVHAHYEEPQQHRSFAQ